MIRLVRVAECGCVVAIAAALYTDANMAARELGGAPSEWREMPLDDAAELFLRSCPAGGGTVTGLAFAVHSLACAWLVVEAFAARERAEP